MYQPQTRAEMFQILTELQTYAEVEGMADLSESLADAATILCLEAKRDGFDLEPAARTGKA